MEVSRPRYAHDRNTKYQIHKDIVRAGLSSVPTKEIYVMDGDYWEVKVSYYSDNSDGSVGEIELTYTDEGRLAPEGSPRKKEYARTRIETRVSENIQGSLVFLVSKIIERTIRSEKVRS